MYQPISLPGMMLDPADPINNGLVGWWPLNEGGGIRANDISLNGNAGTLTNGPAWSGGINRGGLFFDGTNDYVAVQSSDSLQFPGAVPITISCWVNPAQNTAYGTFLIKGRDTDTSATNYAVRQNINGRKLEFYFNQTASGQYHVWASTSDVFTVTDAWYHLAITYTFGTASTLTAYVNGVPYAGSWISGGGGFTADSDTQRLTFGGWLNGAGGERFKGNISEIRIHNRILSQEAIWRLYTQPSVGLYSPNIGRYFVSEGALATSLFDGKIIIKSSGTNLLDGKVQIKDVVTALLDGKVAIGSVQQSLLDGKLTVKDTAVSFLDGKVMVKDIATSLLDGKLEITQGGVGSDLLDGKIQIKDALTALVDGKVIVKSVATDLLDGKLTIGTSATSVFDGKVQIKDIATALLDGKIQVKNATVDLLDGKIIIADGVTSFSKNNQLLIDSIGGKVLQLGNTRINSWNTAGRPVSPKTGTIGLNTQTVALDIYDGSNWKSVTLS